MSAINYPGNSSGATIVVTILTATFNRAHTLRRLAESLTVQTSDVPFEWLIVDDGSMDGTRQLAVQLSEELAFPVRYYWKENGGKHTAFNLGVQLARGEFVMTIDSDDQLHPDGLRNALEAWQSIPHKDRAKFQGVAGLCVGSHGALIGDLFPDDVLDSNTPEVVFRHHVRGDKCGMHRTGLFRQYPFPEHDGMTFVPEGRVWMEMSKHFLTRYVNRPFALVNHDAGNNLSHLPLDHKLEGDREYHGYMLSEQMDWLRFAPKEFLKSAVLFHVAVRRLKGHSAETGRGWTFGVRAKLLLALAWPLSLIPLTWLRGKR